MVRVAFAAAEQLEADGISAEIVDPRTLSPLDEDTIVRSAEKTGRAIVVDEGHNRYGVTAEIASVIADRAFWSLDAPVKRLGALDVPVPFSPPLEDVTVPTPDLVAHTARELVRK
jgi:pyruvate dehydrogenase E1 component beta subunit